jgi:hypothetical protein
MRALAVAHDQSRAPALIEQEREARALGGVPGRDQALASLAGAGGPDRDLETEASQVGECRIRRHDGARAAIDALWSGEVVAVDLARDDFLGEAGTLPLDIRATQADDLRAVGNVSRAAAHAEADLLAGAKSESIAVAQ